MDTLSASTWDRFAFELLKCSTPYSYCNRVRGLREAEELEGFEYGDLREFFYASIHRLNETDPDTRPMAEIEIAIVLGIMGDGRWGKDYLAIWDDEAIVSNIWLDALINDVRAYCWV